MVLCWPSFLTDQPHVVRAQSDPRELFNYDSSKPLNLQEVGRTQENGVITRDVTFDGVTGPISAYIVEPEGTGPYAGILYVHWNQCSVWRPHPVPSGSAWIGSEGSRVSILPNAMWSASQWYNTRVVDDDFQNTINQLIDFRRAIDVLLSLPNVDPARIGFVGRDYGAMFGAILGGVDKRAKTYVLISGWPRFELAYLPFGPQPTDKDAYLKQMAQIDPVFFFRYFSGSVFFQVAFSDTLITQTYALEFFAAARAPKQFASYPEDERLRAPEVLRDRLNWLMQELGTQLIARWFSLTLRPLSHFMAEGEH